MENRERLYDRYLSTRRDHPVPQTLADLKPRAPYLRRVIRRHFPPDRNASILDLGCCEGALLHFARQEGYRNAVGVDWSVDQVAQARRLGIEGVAWGNLMDTLVALPDNSQDVIVTFDVLEHLTKPEVFDLRDSVYRVLKAEGRWIIHAPNAESPFAGRVLYGDFTHELAFTRSSISQLLGSAGFERVECFEDAPVVHGLRSAVRRLIWTMIRASLRLYLMAETGRGGRECLFSQNFLVVAHRG
jgi:2-polyprenyl-3-methyl-5-hydroxy-6-metoxy-1,4-benzoquinol methylase